MVSVLSALIFSGAFAVSSAMLVASIAPQWRRIARLASGKPEEAFAPLQALAAAERRIAVRRWASTPVPAPIHRMRAVA